MSVEDKTHVIDLLPGFVLDALTEEEMRQVREHLAGCADCRVELAHLQLVADELPLALSQAVPSPSVKTNLMQSIHARYALPAPQKSAPISRRIWPVAYRQSLATLALVLIILLVAGNLFLWRQLTLITQGVSAPVRVLAMVNSDFSPNARGTVVLNPSSRYGVLMVADLTSLSADKQYQIWLTKGSEHISAGVFSVDQSGYAVLEIIAPQAFQDYELIAISVEPAGGSLQPTGPNVFQAQIPPITSAGSILIRAGK